MRHQNKRCTKLNRTPSHRKAMLANMAASLIKFERIETTDTKAKALRSFVEKLITLGKRGDLHARRVALSRLRDNDATFKLFAAIAPRMQERNGGYTRITKLSNRRGDNAPVSFIEFVDVDLAAILRLRGATEEQIASTRYAPETFVNTAAVVAPPTDAAPAAEPTTDAPTA
jgi:large subunit ribosomal protein L17